eukprot:366399-Chlamydomonas_euryale.AAC.6
MRPPPTAPRPRPRPAAPPTTRWARRHGQGRPECAVQRARAARRAVRLAPPPAALSSPRPPPPPLPCTMLASVVRHKPCTTVASGARHVGRWKQLRALRRARHKWGEVEGICRRELPRTANRPPAGRMHGWMHACRKCEHPSTVIHTRKSITVEHQGRQGQPPCRKCEHTSTAVHTKGPCCQAAEPPRTASHLF